MNDIVSYVFTGALSAAVVLAVKELVLWKLNRRAKLEDDGREDLAAKIQSQLDEHNESINKVMKILEQLEEKLNTTMSSERVILKDRIKFVAISYIHEGQISFEDKKNINEMWHIYHYDLGGNGDLDDLMKMIDELPIVV